MAQNIATLAVKFIADTFGLKAGAKEAERIITQSAKSAGGNSLKAFGDFFKPGGNSGSMRAFNNFFASKFSATAPGSPFAAGFTKPLTLLQKAGSAATAAISSQGGLAGALAGLGPVGVAAGAALVGVAAGIYGAHKALEQFNASANRIDATSKLATRLDLTYASLQRLTFLAGDSGVPVESLTKAMEHMGRTIGSGGMSLQDRFAEQAKAVAKIADPAERSAAAYKVFGKEAGALIPLLKGLAANSARFDRYSGKFGFAIEEKDAKNIERMNTAWGDLVFIGTQLIDKFVSKFGGPVAAFLETLIMLTEDWAGHIEELGFTWEDVGNFAIDSMNTVNLLMTAFNANLKVTIGSLEVIYGMFQKLQASGALGLAGMSQATMTVGEANNLINSGKGLIGSGSKDFGKIMSGQTAVDFVDRMDKGTDFSSRGGFGSAGGGGMAPSADRFSTAAARTINSALMSSTMTPEQKALLDTAKNTADTKAATEKLVRFFSGNVPVLALGGI